jgi:hypothetical protein
MNIRHSALIALFCVLSISNSLHGQDSVAVFSTIEIKESRRLNEDYTISSVVEKTILISDQRGMDHGVIFIHFDEISRIMRFDAQLVDPKNGRVIKKISPKELREYNRVSRGTFFDDSKYKAFAFEIDKFPAQIQVVYEVRDSGNFYINPWVPLPDEANQILKSARLEFQYPAEIGLRYHHRNTDIRPDSTFSDGLVSLVWKAESIEAFSKAPDDDFPIVLFAPNKFSLDGYTADMKTWEGFAEWQGKLNEGKDELPESLKSQIEGMIKGKNTDFEKIDTLYKYLQQNYRYVSVQLGIGGWMPKSATEVYENKFGECKGLSNLMKAMLKEAGITAQYTKVRAGREADDILLDFPSQQFNHIILRVPIGEEVLWLECTSKHLPTGYLGDFTSNRHVLVVTDDGGFVDKTPAYDDIRYNSYQIAHQIQIDPTGSTKIEGTYLFEGNAAADLIEASRALSGDQKRNYLNARLAGPGLVLSEYSILDITDGVVPKAKVSFSGQIQKYAQNTAKRIILPLSWKKFSKDMLEKGALSIAETTVIQLPEGLVLEGKVPDSVVEEGVLRLNITSSLADNNLTIAKKLAYDPHADIAKEEIEKYFQRIYSQFNKSISFQKPVSNE